VNQEEVESQLSAMFDGELPSAECELLSRRIDRDDGLRARWSRYAMMGAVMRSEPVAPVGNGFASRVSAALANDASAIRRPRAGTFWRSALAASLVVAVAGLSLHLLRNASVTGGGSPSLVADASQSANSQSTDAARNAGAAVTALAQAAPPAAAGSGEPVSYVTPTASAGGSLALQSQLANYVIAHSEYSRPLLRRNLLSALMGNEEALDNAPAGADGVDGSGGGH
jgi:negative regulator of sigma E activity